MENSFCDVLYAISLAVALIEIIAFLAFVFWRSHTLKTLPLALRYYLHICCFPYVIINAVTSLIVAIFYFINNSQQGIVIEILRNFVTFGAQQIRNSLFFLSLERICATVYLEEYTMPERLPLFWYLTISSNFISFGWLGFMLYSKYVPNMYYLFEHSNYYLFAVHVITLGVCSVLHVLNEKMYKLSAYRITLKKRHQIFYNVKILTYIFPSIIIYTVFAPLSSIIAIICANYKLWINPYCLWHISYNLPFLIIFVRYLLIKSTNTKTKTMGSKAVTVIKNAFGKNLPAMVSTEHYFNGLKQLWK